MVLSSSLALCASSFSVGLEASYDYTFISTKTVFADTVESGFHGFDVTVPVEYRIFDWLSVDSGVRYVMKNTRYVNSYGNETRRDFLKLRSFIEFPLTVRLSLNIGRAGVFSGGGAYAGYWIGMIDSGTEHSSMNTDSKSKVTGVIDISSGYNRFDAGLIAEGGVSYAFDIGRLYLAVRYQYTLTSLSARQYNGVNTYLDNLSASAGFLFDL